MPWSVLVLSRSCPPDVGGYQRQLSIVLPLLVERGTAFRGVAAKRTDATGPTGWPGVRTSVLPVSALPRVLQGGSDLVLVLAALALGVVARVLRPRRRPTLLLVSPTMRGSRVAALVWSLLVGPVVARYPGHGGLARSRLAGNPRVRHVVMSPEQAAEAITLGVQAQQVGNAVEAVDRPVTGQPFRRFVVVGRLIATKRVDLVLAAWAEACDDLPQWRLEIIGSGQGGRDDVEAALRQQAHDLARVDLLGEVSDARSHLGGDAVVVHCSSLEGVPNTLLEALAAGSPVLAETASLRRWLGDPPPHLPWDGASAGSLAEVMRGLAGRDDDLRILARSAQVEAQRRWSPDAIATRWQEVLR